MKKVFIVLKLVIFIIVLSCKTSEQLKVETTQSKTLELVFVKTTIKKSENESKLEVKNNPFGPQTEIIFETTKFGNIVIKMHNDLGEFFTSKTFSDIYPGKQTIQLINTEVVPSGVYIYQIFLNSEIIQQKKILILK